METQVVTNGQGQQGLPIESHQGQQGLPIESQMTFEILDDVILPESRRGRIGTGPKYPFDKLAPGKTFFVAQSAQFPDPMKTLTSAVAAAKMKWATKVGMTTKTLPKRGEKNRLVLDANGDRIMETRQVPVYEYTRKFVLRAVVAGMTYGRWQAPHDGCLVQRVL
jgi:hypothetical protein